MSDRARPILVAIIGAGPSGIYAAEALTQQADTDVQVVVLDRLPVPFGLVRYGVAPDHESIRSIRNTLERTLEKSGVRFFGNVSIGVDLSVEELRERTDAVIYAFGAGTDKRLGIDGEDLAGSIAAADFVAWYCGHPDVHPDTDRTQTAVSHDRLDDHRGHQEFADLIARADAAVVVGVGNVALDVTRILIKNVDELADTDMAEEVLAALSAKKITEVHVLGRRGPAYTAFTTKELRELGQIAGVDVIIDPKDLELDESSAAVVGRDKVAARNLAVLNDFAARGAGGADRRIFLHFWTRPVRVVGVDQVQAVEIEGTRLDADGAVEGTGLTTTIAAQLIIRSVGYRGMRLDGVPFDDSTGRVPHAEGRVIRDHGFSHDEYATGWIKRGPTGVIGTNKSDAVETVHSLLADIADGAITGQHSLVELERLLAERGVTPLQMPDWHRIDAAEIELGHSHGRPRTTLAHRSELLAAADDDGTV